MRDVNRETTTSTLSWYKILLPNGFSLIRVKRKLCMRRKEVCQKFLEPSTNSMEFGKACEDLSWNQRTSQHLIDPTNGIAERAVVRQLKEGTSAVLLQSGLDEKWWSDSMECYCCLRNVQEFLADGKTPYGRRFGEPFTRPIISFGAMVQYHPILSRDQARIHQFGRNVLPGIFLGFELIVGEIWKGDILIADLEILEKLDASNFYPQRIIANEVSIRQKDDEFIFPFADGTAKLSGRDYDLRPTVGSEDFSREIQCIFSSLRVGPRPLPIQAHSCLRLIHDMGHHHVCFHPVWLFGSLPSCSVLSFLPTNT